MNPPAAVTQTGPLAGEELESGLEEFAAQDRFAPSAPCLARERMNEASLHASIREGIVRCWS